jgi:hypothetical protein
MSMRTQGAIGAKLRRVPMIVRLAAFASPPPDVRAEAVRNLLERFKPALIAQPGFVAGYWAEAADGRLFSITVWESEAAMEQAGATANATPLLPGQDPAKIPSPDRVETLSVLTSA